MEVLIIIIMIIVFLSLIGKISSSNNTNEYRRKLSEEEQERTKEYNQLVKEYLKSAFTNTIYVEIIMRKGTNQLYSVYVNANEVKCHCVSGYSFLNREFEAFDFSVPFDSFGFGFLKNNEVFALAEALECKLGLDYERDNTEITYSYIEQYETKLKEETIARSGKRRSY